jgi:FAD-linked sulfhydryl oxidase
VKATVCLKSSRERGSLLADIPTMARRQHLTLSVLLGVFLFFSITYFFSGSSSHHVDRIPAPMGESPAESRSEFKVDLPEMPASMLEGESIAPKLENATLKYVSLSPFPFSS